MSVKNPPPEFVIRFGNVEMGQDELAKALGVKLDRYGASRQGSSQYAQISMNSDAIHWTEVAAFLDTVGATIKSLIDQHLIGSACIDFAVYAPTDTASISSTVPAEVALLAGQHQIEIETSVYLSDSDSNT
jgi:hypothetical protein